jgi:hypothetical protein
VVKSEGVGIEWSWLLVGWSSSSGMMEVGQWAGMVVGGWCRVREQGGCGHKRWSGGCHCWVRVRGGGGGWLSLSPGGGYHQVGESGGGGVVG